ncbi:NAD(P)/FAD-dependent oxidoreductase [Paenarthrobacter nitroguajacolicus]|uniref:NAD(P)/FAD-dependent oxidoreductase n=1 Tax=Paenarthrobacter nitroguajacolicus TaxID=211146 RepID=UPI00248AECC2|nr:FAD-dependent oxidoreductase [Paenarthrobacter nitroguajacolicus]
MSSAETRADVLIVGGGQAGAQTALSLRAEGFEGSITILDAGQQLPYERPPLTKAYMRGERDAADLQFRAPEYWEQHHITVVLNQAIESIDPAARTATAASGVVYEFGTLVWAAGGHARRLPFTEGIEGVLSVRVLEDADLLKSRLGQLRDVVVIGGGFIGLEAASVLRDSGARLTILEAMDRLLARVTSPPVSDYFAQLHRSHGADVRLDAVVEAIEQQDGKVSGVRLAGGEVISADAVLVGIGLVPNVQPLVDAGATVSNGVEVDAQGRTSLDGIFAVGDCANRVSDFSRGTRVRLESVPSAVESGKRVADAIMGRPPREESVPWFWSHQFDVKLQTAGLFNGYDDLVVRGEPGSGKFSVVYLCQGVVIAVDTVNNVRDFAQGKALVTAKAAVDRERLLDKDLSLKELIPTS